MASNPLLDYAPGTPPSDPAQFARFWQDEARKVQAVLRNIRDGRRQVLHAAPAKPQPGMIVYADGTDWNPGSGEGTYQYSIAGSWVLVG